MSHKSTRLWQRALLLLFAAGLAGWLLSPVGAAWLTPVPAETFEEEPLLKDPLPVSTNSRPRMDGVSLTAPPRPVQVGTFPQLKAQTAADWVSVIPYAFCFPDDPAVHFDASGQWWGERSEGVVAQVQMARQQGMRVMLKPHVWVVRGGWIGEYGFDREEDWEQWERAYTRYILRFAQLADSLDADLFCLSTETERAVRERPAYWPQLIAAVRKVYDGPLTYAANWDNYQNIPFWRELDYIGIDAYFPLKAGDELLTQAAKPTSREAGNRPVPKDSEQAALEALLAAWEPHVQGMVAVQQQVGKPVLFTEYGYLSVPGNTWQTWKLENQLDRLPADPVAQRLAYQALYQTFWTQEWFAGGFLWKWYLDQDSRLKEYDRDYTPQGKEVLGVIRTWYQ